MMLPHKDSRYDTHSLDRYRADKANGYHNNFDPHPPQRVSTVVMSSRHFCVYYGMHHGRKHRGEALMKQGEANCLTNLF